MKASFPRDQTARKRPARVFHDDRPCAKWRAVARRLPRAISFAGRTSKQSGARRKRRSVPARTRRFCRARKKHESFVSHSRVPGADKAQARHEPLISSLERGRRNCDVLAKRSNLRFFWFSSDSNAGILGQSRGVLGAEFPRRANRRPDRHDTRPTLRDSNAHTRSLVRTELFTLS